MCMYIHTYIYIAIELGLQVYIYINTTIPEAEMKVNERIKDFIPRADPIIFGLLEGPNFGPGALKLHNRAGRPAARAALPGSMADEGHDEDSSSTPTLALQLCSCTLSWGPEVNK